MPGAARVVAVASGKGGVGKTTVSLGLAYALIKDGNRVGLFDADLYGPNVPRALGLRRTKPGNAFVPLARAGRDPYLEPVERFGLRVMSMGFLVAESEALTPDPLAEGALIRQTLLDVAWGST